MTSPFSELANSFTSLAEVFTPLAAQIETWLEESGLMDGWVVIGECYVKPIDWEELWLIEPDGVQYAAYRHHLMGDKRILIGTAPTPRAAARLAGDAVAKATGGAVDRDESRRNHGLAPRPRRRRADV